MTVLASDHDDSEDDEADAERDHMSNDESDMHEAWGDSEDIDSEQELEYASTKKRAWGKGSLVYNIIVNNVTVLEIYEWRWPQSYQRPTLLLRYVRIIMTRSR
jgi:hypothetical protein